MEGGLQLWLRGRVDAVKESVLTDMHRMACGWAGRELPAAPMNPRAGSEGKADLTFPLRSRQ